ncbi:MAG: DegT/DnrJ/EryC1/StrS family aminotransferase [Erysipelotrichaceae bacterium]|nr:DegT/DnrJ/EryC1/StrS family aminotransferase [Erysipelotrichaceae bacterium]
MEFIDLKKQYEILKQEIDANIQAVLDDGHYIMGAAVSELEKELADYIGVKHCITCANGTDALSLALMAWDIKSGDAVFVPSFTFYATAEVVSLIGATPIFIDSDPRTFNIDVIHLRSMIENVIKEGKLTPRAIIPVDLFGQPAEYEEIMKIAKDYNLLVLEDGAQGFGGSINGKKACSFGDISTTSFFPAKPLGCYGDGGAVFTDSDVYYEKLVSLRVHGKGSYKYDNVRVGLNSRLDTLQAAILLPKLHAFIDYELNSRNEIADIYNHELNDIVITPLVKENMQSSWAQYTILLNDEQERNELQQYLKSKGIPSMIYYPKPLHMQSVYKDHIVYSEDLKNAENLSRKCLSLPMHPYLEREQIITVCNEIKLYLQKEMKL